MRKWLFSTLAIGFGVVCALFFRASYRDAKQVALAMLLDEQRIHARQAALGIEDFFATWTNSLSALSRVEGIVRNDASGRHDLSRFFEAHQQQIRSILRVDEQGTILVSYPFEKAEGSNISAQRHVAEIRSGHRPVVSDVFRAVQGFDAIALHVPVFEGTEFRGTIGVTFNFENLAHRYFDVIRIGRTGFAWVLSRDGTILYAPTAGLAGRAAGQVFRDSPSIAALFRAMQQGRQGTATYTTALSGEGALASATRYAVYMPIQVGTTFWSVAVSAGEQELLASLDPFRNRLAAVVVLVFVGSVLLSFVAVRAGLRAREAERRHRVEDALRESESRHRAILQTAMDGFCLADAEGRLLEVNDTYCRMTGFGEEELLGMRLQELEAAGSAEEPAGLLGGILRRGEGRFESRNRRKDGSLLDVEFSIQSQPGEGDRLVIFVRDITERRRAERLRVAAYRLSDAAMGSGSLDELFGKAHGIVDTLTPSQNFYIALLDAEAGTLAFPYFVDEYDPPPPPKALTRGLTEYVIRTGEPLLASPEVFDALVERGEVEALGAPGIDWLGAPLKASGQTIGAVVVQSYTAGVRYGPSDREFLAFVSDHLAAAILRKRMEETLRESERELREAQAIAGFGSYVLEVASGRWRSSPTLDTIFGISRDWDRSVAGWGALIHEEDRAEMTRYVLDEVLGKGSRFDRVYRIVRPADGEVRWVHGRGEVSFGPDGRVARLQGTIADVTEREAGAERIRRLNEELERRVAERTSELETANRELESFSYSVSHDLRAPLRAIEGFSGMLVKESSDHLTAEDLRLLDVVRTNARKMSELIDDLLAFSRTGRHEMRRGRLAMKSLVLAAFAEAAGGPDSLAEIDLKLAELPDVEGDHALVRQVWINLLSNALKFSARKEKPRIEVGGGLDGPFAVYHVRDNGVGFDPRYVDKLFGVFQRLHGVNEFEGTGIGLALVKRIVERHGGRVWAEGEPGVGATFFFSLPLAKAAEAADTSRESSLNRIA